MNMFFAYASNPSSVGEIIESAVKKINSFSEKIKSWKEVNVVGSFIIAGIQKAIDEREVFVADITTLNFNVTYEVGYAIGRGKKILIVKNKSITESDPRIGEVGIFDTIGYSEYTNSDQLYAFLLNPNANVLLGDRPQLNTKVPLYILEQKFKTDYATRITARIKKAKYFYRSFDPNETPRLSAYDAINQVGQSYGVLVSLLSKETNDYKIHNLRAAFIAGLAHGMNKATCILQHGDEPVPIDYRDFVNVYYKLEDIDNHIADFAGRIVEAFQEGKEVNVPKHTTSLQKLDFGSSSAENEMRTLQGYYLKTDAFNRALRGEVQLVVGRKGSGKSAIFLQIRDKERSRGKNIVLDLKPEGYKLIKFKELILSYLQEGTLHHTIIAFWEYILLLEICHKALENDKARHMNDSELYAPYRSLQESYKKEHYLTDGDFSERMSRLMDNLTTSYKEKYGEAIDVRLSSAEITNLLYKSDISILRNHLIEYVKHKDKVWLLLDNIDKGWPSSGLQQEDFIIMRTLIDALRSIQRQFSKERIDMYPIIFLRNDVYELLVERTSDRQKEAKELLDWVDQDLLREVIKLRIKSSLDLESDDFEEVWRMICVSHYKGEETSQYLIERSLMRPRFLINLISQCKGFAVNLNHSKIEAEDIEKGFRSYSADLLTDISYEIRDVFPEAENVLYTFIASHHELTDGQLRETVREQLDDEMLIDRLIDLLLWHGFLGVKSKNSDISYIYSLNYNMKLLKGLIQKYNNEVIYVINPSFWPSLMIHSNEK
jgi:hypothetical protein